MGVFGRFREKVLCRAAELWRFGQHVFVLFLAKVSLLSQVSEVGGPGHFKATSNDRVNFMYKEGCEFARRLDKCARQIKAVESATSGTSRRDKNRHRFCMYMTQIFIACVHCSYATHHRRHTLQTYASCLPG